MVGKIIILLLSTAIPFGDAEAALTLASQENEIVTSMNNLPSEILEHILVQDLLNQKNLSQVNKNWRSVANTEIYMKAYKENYRHHLIPVGIRNYNKLVKLLTYIQDLPLNFSHLLSNEEQENFDKIQKRLEYFEEKIQQGQIISVQEAESLLSDSYSIKYPVYYNRLLNFDISQPKKDILLTECKPMYRDALSLAKKLEIHSAVLERLEDSIKLYGYEPHHRYKLTDQRFTKLQPEIMESFWGRKHEIPQDEILQHITKSIWRQYNHEIPQLETLQHIKDFKRKIKTIAKEHNINDFFFNPIIEQRKYFVLEYFLERTKQKNLDILMNILNDEEKIPKLEEKIRALILNLEDIIPAKLKQEIEIFRGIKRELFKKPKEDVLKIVQHYRHSTDEAKIAIEVYKILKTLNYLEEQSNFFVL